MSDSSSYNSGARPGGPPPHGFDPWMQPELFRGVLTRRLFAFLIDLVVLSIPVVLACMFIAVFGVVTLGFGWTLFWLVSPASVIWAIVYYGASLGGPHSATPGMRLMNLQLRTWHGAGGPASAPPAWAARLFRIGRVPRGSVLAIDLVLHAADPAGRAVQRQ